MLTLTPCCLLGGLKRDTAPTPIGNACWYVATAIGDGLRYTFEPGALERAHWLTADLLQDGNQLGVFQLTLKQGDQGPEFQLYFGLLNQCSARMRMQLEAVNQNRWRYEREGAWLKPMCGGQRVDLSKVDRMTVTVLRKGPAPVRWCMTDVVASANEPPMLEDIVLPRGPLLDELGQSTLHEWPAKSRSAHEVTARLRAQLDAVDQQRWPSDYSRWGGWLGRQVAPSGFFRTHNDGARWWLVDPDGYLFWSAGMDCVGANVGGAYAGLESALTWLPDKTGDYAQAYTGAFGDNPNVNYLAANLLRAFGPDWHNAWQRIAIAELKRWSINTIGNWSEWQTLRAYGFPYVRPLHFEASRVANVYRDFPDVFDPQFEQDAADYAAQLADTATDPALIGYFLMNEPTWGFAQETPAAGMLFNTPDCATRRELAAFLRHRYGSDQAFATAWSVDTTLHEIEVGVWRHALNETAHSDLSDFSSRMVLKLFSTLTTACRKVDPNHLNLGARYYTVPPDWALAGMSTFDVFSMNCYKQQVPADTVASITRLLNKPVLVGEWHFGALDVGLPGSGIGHVRDQAARGAAYRTYVENAAALPGCVGVHYFTYYDESAIGRFDGENWNIGFVDVCNRAYEQLVEAARLTHERLYQVASGALAPFSDAPEYLPMLFL